MYYFDLKWNPDLQERMYVKTLKYCTVWCNIVHGDGSVMNDINFL